MRSAPPPSRDGAIMAIRCLDNILTRPSLQFEYAGQVVDFSENTRTSFAGQSCGALLDFPTNIVPEGHCAVSSHPSGFVVTRCLRGISNHDHCDIVHLYYLGTAMERIGGRTSPNSVVPSRTLWEKTRTNAQSQFLPETASHPVPLHMEHPSVTAGNAPILACYAITSGRAYDAAPPRG